MMIETVLSMRDVSRVHGSAAAAVQALRGVNLDVAAGELVAVMGPSGSGKSTLLNLAGGLDSATSGEVFVEGTLLAGLSKSRLAAVRRRSVGYVFQELNLIPALTAAENVALPRELDGLSSRKARAEALDALREVDLADLADRFPDELSGGQQQRVALARALARRPRIVLLDEPFSSLDAGLRTSTREAVADALEHEGITVVLVTHDQAEALSFSDQVAIMHDGRFSQVGTPSEVYATPADRHSAAFLGDAVFLRGRANGARVTTALGALRLHEPSPEGPVDVLLRPEQIHLVDMSPGRPCAEVLSTTYFGHDALVALRLQADRSVVTARVHGSDVPHTGSIVGLSVDGDARAFTVG
jgi:iron(III) transport system ATP-binding protein